VNSEVQPELIPFIKGGTMEYTVRQFSSKNWGELEKALKVKTDYIRAKGLDRYPPIFDIGDEVGFFYGSSPSDHAVGIIIAENEMHVTIRCRNGQTFNTSPFLIFALR
jgi:hypothetical protein